MNTYRRFSSFTTIILALMLLNGCSMATGFIAGAGTATYLILSNKK